MLSSAEWARMAGSPEPMNQPHFVRRIKPKTQLEADDAGIILPKEARHEIRCDVARLLFQSLGRGERASNIGKDICASF